VTADGPGPTQTQSARRLPLADLVITVGLLVAFVVAFITARSWPYGAAVFPEMVTAVGVALAVLHLVVLVVRRPAPDLRPHGQDGEIEALDVEYVFEHAGRRAWAADLGWLAGFFVLTYVAGVLVAAPVFTVLYLALSARKSWLFSAIYAVVLGVVLYVSYTVVLELPLPEGILS
jgi:hypothetical protein